MDPRKDPKKDPKKDPQKDPLKSQKCCNYNVFGNPGFAKGVLKTYTLVRGSTSIQFVPKS